MYLRHYFEDWQIKKTANVSSVNKTTSAILL